MHGSPLWICLCHWNSGFSLANAPLHDCITVVDVAWGKRTVPTWDGRMWGQSAARVSTRCDRGNTSISMWLMEGGS